MDFTVGSRFTWRTRMTMTVVVAEEEVVDSISSSSITSVYDHSVSQVEVRDKTFKLILKFNIQTTNSQ